MLRTVIAGALALGLAGGLPMPVDAQSAPEDVESVIGAQIEAFQADDFARAFTFAAPGIKQIFRTPENFGRMVQQGYPMVWRPAEVTFADRELRGAQVYQRVVITDQSGNVHVLLYEMSPAGDSWQISGVQILQAPQVGA